MPIIANFKGIRPAVSEKLLPTNFAQKATNCDLLTGKIRPLKTLLEILKEDEYLAGYGYDSSDTFCTIYKTVKRTFGGTDAAIKFYAWATNTVSIIELSEDGNDEWIIYANPNDSYPRIAKMNDNVGYGSEPTTYYRLGMTAPSSKVTATVIVGSAGGTTVQDNVTYVVTHVNSLKHESAPSLPSSVVTVMDGEHVELSGFTAAASSDNVTHRRFYRSVTAADGTVEYQLVKVAPTSVTGTKVYDVPVAVTKVYDVDDGTNPILLSSDLGEVLQTDGWDPPPAGFRNICQFQNGIVAGTYGSKVYLSVPGFYYAFPVDYQYAIGSYPIAMGVYNETLIVATRRHPYTLVGMDSASMDKIEYRTNQSCVSRRSFVITPYGAIWATPDGLYLFNGTPPGTLLTKNIFTREQWQAYDIDSIIGGYYNGCYYAFFAESKTGLVINFEGDDSYAIELSLPRKVLSLYVDSESDSMYLGTYDDDDELCRIEKWDAGSTYLTHTWQSKVFQVPPQNYSRAQVIGLYTDRSLTFKYYADQTVTLSKSVSTDEEFYLPAGRQREVEVEVTGTAEVDIIGFDHSALGLLSSE